MNALLSAAPAGADSAAAAAAPRYLVLSAHDYRTPRRANIHFIAEQLAQRGPTRFFSLRYSRLSRWKGDARLPLDDTANRVVEHRGVECYLWRALVHPFNTRRRWARPLENAMFDWYARHPPQILRQWMQEADVIVFESGTAIAFIELARQVNPRARLVYRASDALSAIDVADWVARTFDRVAPALDVIALVSPAMAGEIASRDNVFHVGHGIDHGLEAMGDPNPYGEGIHAVAVGSMLFDPRFFVTASRAFPDVTFHVIGSGMGRHPDYGDNVVVYGEMKHAETIRYIKHARVGIAPYASSQVPAYLADSSMKLLQYDFFGLPAVCPYAVVGGYRSRFGYTPGDEASIVAAMAQALAAPRERLRQCLDWAQTTDRVLDPAAYPDTRIAPVR
ncbi:MAG TPA: glycosyltransferase family 1 protein [Stenotrophomonas sp.]